MRFVFEVEVEVERTSGKFVSREEIANEIISELEGADPGSVDVEESEYEVIHFAVAEKEGSEA